MIATWAAIAALMALAAFERLDPAPVRAALAAWDAAASNAIPLSSAGGAMAVLDTQLSIAVGAAAFAVTLAAAAGAGNPGGRWLRWSAAGPQGAVTRLLLGMALVAGGVRACAALRVAGPLVCGALVFAMLAAGRGPATLGRWIRAAVHTAPGWIRPAALVAAAFVALAGLAPATGDPALSATLPAASGLRWDESGAVDALMGAALAIDRGVVAAVGRMFAAVGLFAGDDPAIRLRVADAAVRLWSTAGWLIAAASLAAAFRPRDAAGRWAAGAIVATSPGLAALALADQPRLFMLAPAVACAGWIGRGRIVRAALMAVIAGWFGAGGPPGRVAGPDLWRLALAGLAAGALVASPAPGRWLRAAATASLAVMALHTATLAAATGGLLAGAGLESHPGYFLRSTGIYGEMLTRVARTVPPGERVWVSGEPRRYPLEREILTDREVYRGFSECLLDESRYRPRLRQLRVIRVFHLPAPDSVIQLGKEVRSADRFGYSSHDAWMQWWKREAVTVDLPDRIADAGQGYYEYTIDRTGTANGIPAVTIPLGTPLATIQGISGVPEAEARRALHEGLPPRDMIGTLDSAVRRGYRSAAAYTKLAELLAAEGRHDEAVVVLETLHELNAALGKPELRSLHLRLAAAARSRRDPAVAERHVRAVLDLFPGDAAAWAELAELLRWQGRMAEAVDAIRQACRLAPDHPGYRGTLGTMRRAL